MARRAKAKPAQYCIGHMNDDLATVAGYIVRLTGEGNCQVWVDVDASLNAAVCCENDDFPEDWLIGVYSAGISARLVLEDLHAVRSQWTEVFAL